MRFKLVEPASTLPKTMPETIVYWNRCETKINPQNEQIINQD